MVVILDPDPYRILAFDVVIRMVGFAQRRQAARAERQTVDMVFQRFALYAAAAAADPAFTPGHQIDPLRS
ncbi:hypothetical protein AK51_13785 [Serratia nematodiphila DZ0503SBS1]|nr:hypothetical protein AK51_13785 [Serratia nematodiphila DZ0503SBS1]